MSLSTIDTIMLPILRKLLPILDNYKYRIQFGGMDMEDWYIYVVQSPKEMEIKESIFCKTLRNVYVEAPVEQWYGLKK